VPVLDSGGGARPADVVQAGRGYTGARKDTYLQAQAQVTLAQQVQDALDCYRGGMAHDAEVKSVLRAYKKALDALQRLDKARRDFRSALLDAHEAGASKAELGRALGVSRQRVDEVLTRARHERAVGVEDVTD
jgi:DNA-directed RNA polymerase specialized sigma24 family protein